MSLMSKVQYINFMLFLPWMIEFCSELAINVQHIDMQVMHEIYDLQRYHHLFGDVTFCAILYYLGHLVFVEWR